MAASIAGVLLGFVGVVLLAVYGIGIVATRRDDGRDLWLLAVGGIALAAGVIFLLA